MATASPKPNYGIDAPGLFRSFCIATVTALGALIVAHGFLIPNSWLGTLIRSLLGLATLYFLGMSGLMLYGSKVMKLKDREELLDAINWTGAEQVLDVGCGRGLMLVGAAKRLSTGTATGIDLWQQQDQAHNSAEAALNNAALEGVASRIKVQTADMRQLPFANDSFDVVTSSWTIHNLGSVADRELALREIVRALKPGGWLLLIDIVNQREYATYLRNQGMRELTLHNHPVRDVLLKAVSFGSFAPAAVLACKP